MKSSLLDSKWRVREQMVLAFLAILAIVLTGVYINLAPFFSRADIMIIPFGVKTLIVFSYEMLTEHVSRFAKWRSPKANVILNCLEPVFWLTAVVLKFMAITRFCDGDSCVVNWVLAWVVIVMLFWGLLTVIVLLGSVLSLHVAVISIKDYRGFKKYGSATAP